MARNGTAQTIPSSWPPLPIYRKAAERGSRPFCVFGGTVTDQIAARWRGAARGLSPSPILNVSRKPCNLVTSPTSTRSPAITTIIIITIYETQTREKEREREMDTSLSLVQLRGIVLVFFLSPAFFFAKCSARA